MVSGWGFAEPCFLSRHGGCFSVCYFSRANLGLKAKFSDPATCVCLSHPSGLNSGVLERMLLKGQELALSSRPNVRRAAGELVT